MERDAWVQAIDQLCSDWKRKSKNEVAFEEIKGVRHLSIAEYAEDTKPELESSDELGGSDTTYPEDYATPVAKPLSTKNTDVILPDISPPAPSLTSPDVLALSTSTFPQPSPSNPIITPSSPGPECLKQESDTPVVIGLPPLRIPPPPPLPVQFAMNLRKPLTKTFHWDLVGKEKVTVTVKAIVNQN